MRNLAILFFLTLSHYTFSQDKKTTFDQYPFQVVYAENVKLADGVTIVGRYDYIDKGAELKLNGGSLILMHHSEKLFEFKGDMLLSIAEVLNGMPEYLIRKQVIRPDISFFFTFRNPETYSATIRCHGYVYSFQGFKNSVLKINSNQSLWLYWKTASEKDVPDYTISIRNITDSLLDRLVIKEAKFQLDPTKYEPRPELLVIQVVNNINEDWTSEMVGIWLDESWSIYIPDWENLNSSLDFLQAWYFLSSRDNYTEARNYLDRLNQKSNHPFYQKLVETWKKQ